jgi:hypothetical protein
MNRGDLPGRAKKTDPFAPTGRLIHGRARVRVGYNLAPPYLAPSAEVDAE